MKTNTTPATDKLAKLSPAGLKAHADVLKTRSVPVLTAVVKEAINVRDRLMGKEVSDIDHAPTLARVKDSKSRKRAQGLLEGIRSLESRKDVSILCAAAIAQRKLARAEKAARKPAAEPTAMV